MAQHSFALHDNDASGYGLTTLAACFFDITAGGSGLRACRGVELAAGAPVMAAMRRSITGRMHPIAAADGQPVAGCLPAAAALTVWMEAPFASWSKSRRVLPALLDAQLPFALEDCCYGFVAVRRTGRDKRQVLAVAARRSEVRARIDLYRSQGMDPVIIDHEGLALWRHGLEVRPPPAADAARVILYVKPASVVMVFGRGADYLATHELAWDAAAGPDRQPLDDLLRRMSRVVFSELRDGARPEWLLCAGPDAGDLAAALAGRLPGGGQPPYRPPDEHTFLARALAARALAPGAWHCNLRTGVLAHPLTLGRQRRHIRRCAGWILSAGLLLMAVNGYWQRAVRLRTAVVQSEISALAAELAPKARIPYGREVFEVRRALEDQSAALEPLYHARNPGLYNAVAAILDEIADAGAVCRNMQVDMEGFELHGAAADWDRCEMLAGQIRARGHTVRIEALPGLEDGRAAFRMWGRWRI